MNEKVIEGISDIRDESSSDGIRVAVGWSALDSAGVRQVYFAEYGEALTAPAFGGTWAGRAGSNTASGASTSNASSGKRDATEQLIHGSLRLRQLCRNVFIDDGPAQSPVTLLQAMRNKLAVACNRCYAT